MNNKAFTFVEIIMSSVLIAIMAAGMLGAFLEARFIFDRARHRFEAFSFAQRAADILRSNYRYDSDPQMSVEATKPESNLGTVVEGELNSYNPVLTYDVTEEPSGGYKALTIRVTWDDEDAF